jgi:hypothetical protein
LTRLPTFTPEWRKVTVYFVDSKRLSSGLIPFEVGVVRYGRSSANPIGLVLDEYFKGPGDVEKRNGLINILNGFTGYSRVFGDNGVLNVYLIGTCQYTTQIYSVAQALITNLKQFPDVLFVKIYDQNGQTRLPSGRSDSAPACLGSSALLLPTRTPTATPIK